ncbi:Rh178 [macacine betaherpesvirus 3]|nr:Rh178 [macacine betaherpesvirus 3]
MLSYMYVMCTFFRFTFAFTVTTLFVAFLLALTNEFCRCCGFSLRQRSRYLAVQRLLPMSATYRLCKRVFRAVSVPVYALISSFSAVSDNPTPSAQLHANDNHTAFTEGPNRALRTRSLSPRSACHHPVHTHTSYTTHTTADSSSSSSTFHSVLLHHATAAAQGSRLSRPPRPPRHHDNNDSALSGTGARRKLASRHRSDYHDSSPRPARSPPKAL